MDASSGQYSFLGPKQLQFKSLISLLEYYKYASLAVLEGIHVYCCGDSKSKHWVKNGRSGTHAFQGWRHLPPRYFFCFLDISLVSRINCCIPSPAHHWHILS